jgi:flavin reductase (DIM6/NTAB) family NADH-FMN oxidoreductase RutF/DNA-binding GntR family transcriptional regulator
MSTAASTGAQLALADQQAFRDVIGRFASGLTVITTTVDRAPFGTTASAVSSLSLEPPMVLVCLNKASETQAAILKAGAFCVNILAEGQQDLAYQLAGKGDKFAGTGYQGGIDGVPVLRDTLAHLECRVAETVTGGTHTVFLAHVAVAAGREGAPLTYFRGRFGRLESVREEEAYRAVRNWVLTRRVPLDQPVELATIAGSLELEPGHVAYALVRLAGENVVTRTEDGRYRPTPFTVELADELFDARCVIELGIAEQCIGGITDDDLAVLDSYAERLGAIVAQRNPSLAEFLDASHGYHRHFVGLAGSPQLVDAYRRLGISTLWRQAIAEQDWWTRFDVSYHAGLSRACRDRDIEQARRLIPEHTQQVRELVRSVIDRAGGAL